MAQTCLDISFWLVSVRATAFVFRNAKSKVLTPSLKPQGVRGRFSAISLAVLTLVCTAPCLAAPAKADKTAASKTKPGKPALRLTAVTSEDGKTDKTAAGKTLASGDKPAKGPQKDKNAKATRLADATSGKPEKAKGEKTKSGKTVELAAARPAKGKAAEVALAVPKSSVRVSMKLASSTSVKPAVKSVAPAFQSPVKVTMDLSKVPAAAPIVSMPEAAPVMNAAPVPYKIVAAQRTTTVPPVAIASVLAPYDIELYQTAFSQIDSGDYDGAEASLALVNDRSLVGYAEFHKLFSRGYTASYDELTAWLNQYGDEPMAMSVWNLAKRKKPAGSPDPAFPLINGKPATVAPDGTAVQLASYTTLDTPLVTAPSAGPTLDSSDSDLTPKSARSAYNNGQLDQAVTLARKIGDHWVAGLADWRLGRFADAETEFKFVSTDPSRNAWSQSSGAYWAGRCAMRQGHDDDATTYFKIAASFPFTFYGLLAEQRLGVTPAVTLALQGQTPTFGGSDRTALSDSLTDDFAWTANDPKAVRLNALIQIGRNSDAQKELQAAVQTSKDGDDRDRWLAVAARTRIDVSQLKPADRLFDASIYPMPAYKPKGGFRVDKALVYAFARKESKFNATAISYSGAYGLLQMMPATAALIESDSSFSAKPGQLLKPAVNLRVGQDYIEKLSGSPIVSGDLLRTIAAYNGGPRPVKDALDSLGPDADALLVMESIPVAQTRQYVEEVAANYWIYRQLMGKKSETLAMAAGDAKLIDASADR